MSGFHSLKALWMLLLCISLTVVSPKSHAENNLPAPPNCQALVAGTAEEIRLSYLAPGAPKDRALVSIKSGQVTMTKMNLDSGVDWLAKVLIAQIEASTELLRTDAPLKDLSRVDVLLAKAGVKLVNGTFEYATPEKYDSRFVEIKGGITSTEIYLQHLSEGRIVIAENIKHRYLSNYLVYKIPILTLQSATPTVWKGVMDAAKKLLSIAKDRNLSISDRLSALDLGDQLLGALNAYGFGVAARQSNVFPMDGTALEHSKLLTVLGKINSLEKPSPAPAPAPTPTGILGRLRNLISIKKGENNQLEVSKQNFDFVSVDIRTLIGLLFDREDLAPKHGDTMFGREKRFLQDLSRILNSGDDDLHYGIEGAMVRAWIKFQMPELEKLSDPPADGVALEQWLTMVESRFGLSVELRIIPRSLAMKQLEPIVLDLYGKELSGMKDNGVFATGERITPRVDLVQNRQQTGRIHIFEKWLVEKDILLDAIFKNFMNEFKHEDNNSATTADILKKYGLESKSPADVKVQLRKLLILNHPDTAGQIHGNTTQLMQLIADYERLKDLGFFK